MVSKVRSRAALGFAIIGIALTAGTLVLPGVRTHQVALVTGPAYPYGSATTTLSGYLIPPVEKGTNVSIVITGYSPHSIYFSLFPARGGDIAASGPPLILTSNFTGQIARLRFVSPDTQAYGIYIVSGNRSQYVLAVEGVWSPYYYLRGYASEGLFLLLVGFLAYYYFRHWEFRRSVEEKAMAEAKATPSR